MIDYLNLKIGAARRLGFLRNAAKRHSEKFPSGSAATWRTVRYATLTHPGGLSPAMNGGAPIWYAETGPAFPRETYADLCAEGPDHHGWFTDAECDEKARGIVVRLPHGKFLAGCEWSANGGRVYFPEVFADERDAARRADSHAESFADDCLEHDAKYHEAQKLQDEAENMAQHLAEKLALRNDPRFPNAREEARELLTELRDLRQRLRDEFADFL